MSLVSVIVPTFNNAALLAETLDGIRRQTLDPVELIVVDDGSTDHTAEIVKGYDPDIRYYYQPNRGQASARNKGVAVARGEFIAFCDHDDIWNERHLEKLSACFTAFPQAAMVFDNAEYFGDGTPSGLHLPPHVSHSRHQKKINTRWLFRKYPVASMSVVMVRKKALDELNGLDEHVGVMDDYHFYLRLAAASELRYVDYVGCKKRVSCSNLSRLANLKEMNLIYLEDIRRNHRYVIQQLGPVNFRVRLARKYFKLGRYYLSERKPALAAKMLWSACLENPFNPRYLLGYIRVRSSV